MRSHLNNYSNWQSVILPFMRLGYLSAIFQKISNAHAGFDGRMGFVREDILCLAWMRKNHSRLMSEIAQV
jgi:hypothetical protein